MHLTLGNYYELIGVLFQVNVKIVSTKFGNTFASSKAKSSIYSAPSK